MNQLQLNGLAFWGKFLAWTFIVSGIFNALVGLFAFIIGAIPGLISIFMGIKLLSASNQAKKLSTDEFDENTLNQLLSNYLVYFKIQGILILVSLIIGVISLSLFGFAFLGSLAQLAN